MKLSVSNFRHYPVRISYSAGMPEANCPISLLHAQRGRTHASGFVQAVVVGQVK
jgi:hypothetical protein